MTGIIYHELFGRHLEGYGHVESPDRYKAVMERLSKCTFSDSLKFIEAQPAEVEWIEEVHDSNYVNDIITMRVESPVVLDWGDTVATSSSQKAALYSAGAAVQASRLVLEGDIDNAFSTGRPPGHHAERDRAMGFCIFNNISIAAAWLLRWGGLKKIAIIDWDVHHGNGTERIFLGEERVYYISLHQYPHYPGTGHFNTTGTGSGKGYTLNIPVGTGATDELYLAKFENDIIPALERFEPEFILISAGFDAHGADPLSGGLLSSGVFAEMTSIIRKVADKYSNGRIVSLLEGGYDLDALAESVEKHVKALL